VYHPPDFSRVFRDGEIFKVTVYPPVREESLQIELVSLGELSIPSGKIVAFDPTYSDYEVFDRSVPSGRYAVWLALAHDESEYQKFVIASAMFKFQQAEAVDWKMAFLAQDADPEIEDIYCYSVDAGIGSFADERAASIIVGRPHNSAETNSFYDALDKHSLFPNRQCSNVILDSDTGLNICVFSSGYGDGCYPSYWGFGADGSIIALATDFMLGEVDEEDEE
jgi:hypothetical protein